MKKTVSLLIALVMIVALAVPAFAVESPSAEPYAVCNHTFGLASGTVIGYEYVNDNQCREIMQFHRTCTKCGYIKTWEEGGGLVLHDRIVVTASCDGYVQTWIEKCGLCGTYGLIEKVPCRDKGHNPGHCDLLPV